MYFEILNKKVKVNANDPAIFSEGATFTYAQLNEQINKAAGWLKYLGIKAGQHAAILSENNVDFVILTLALWKLQAVPVPMNTRLHDEEIERLASHSVSGFVFVHERLKARMNLGGKIVFPTRGQSYSFERPAEKIKDENTALMLYTSGTTGKPKGVMLSYKNLISSAASSNFLIKHSRTDRWLASLPFYHIGGFSIFIRAFLFGSSVIVPEAIKAESLKSTFARFRPTLASFVSTTLKQLLEDRVAPNPELRLVLLGGGPAEDRLVDKASKEGWKIAKVYGSTETSSLVTAMLVSENPSRLSSSGRPLPNNKIFIIGENGIAHPSNKTGEVLICGDSIMKGYWNDSVLTETKLVSGRYYSGDLGYIDDEGYLFIESRRTDLIISGGENINPSEVEEALLRFPGVKEACIFPLEDSTWGQIVAALIVPLNKSLRKEDLLAFLRDILPHYKIPKKFFISSNLPKTSLGKVRRDVVRQRFENKRDKNK